MGCAGSAAAKYEPKCSEEGQAVQAEPCGEWRVEESANEWTPIAQDVGKQLLDAFYGGELEAVYSTEEGSYHVDFYNQLQTHHETGRQCRIAWFGAEETAAEEPTRPEVYLGGEWLIEEEGAWRCLDPEISAQLLVAWYCGEQLLHYELQGRSYEVDLTVWEQKDVETGQRRRIVWNSSDPDDARGSVASTDASEDAPDVPPWLDPGEEAERQLFAALESKQPVVRYMVNGCEFEVDTVNMIQTNLSTGERWMIAVEGEEPEPGCRPEHGTGDAQAEAEPSQSAFAAGASEPRAVPTAKGKPKAFIYKAVPDPSKPPPRQKKWSLAPGKKPKLAGPKAQAAAGSQAGQACPKPKAELLLPKGVEWPVSAKARRVAEAVFADMRKSREKPLAHRRRAYMAACLSWHPDKNLKHQDVATEVFQFLQAVKDWYFGAL
ncbi:unnamed protein product [Effrenium voratum]|nr:unnamed protein product [Effrenium voratum]CAJ1335148.1 unnamed protein product [Effrenium voratum]